MPQFVGVLIAIAVACLIAWKAATEFGAWYSAGGAYYVWLTVGIIVAVIAFPIAVFWYFEKLRWHRIYAKMPEDGPMKLDLTVQEIPATLAMSVLSGARTAHRLHINVRMSKKDYEAMGRTGLSSRELFDHPHPKYPRTRVSFCGNHLWNTPYVDFPDTIEAERAKAALIEGLHNLRSHIDATREKTVGGRPRPTSESHEI